MCLDKVDKVPDTEEGVGWKIVEKDEKGNYRPYLWNFDSDSLSYPIGEWIEDKQKYTVGFYYLKYPTGVHIYTEKPTLMDSHAFIIKVEFKDVVASGIQDGKRVKVVRKVKNLGEVEG